jgi:hypothetical protein
MAEVRECSIMNKLFLIVLQTIQAVGIIMDAKWIAEGMVYTGKFCTIQGWYLAAILELYERLMEVLRCCTASR